MIIPNIIHQWRLIICVAINNSSKKTVGGSCCSAHQAEHICLSPQWISFVHRKCQTRAGVSGDINKSFECITIYD